MSGDLPAKGTRPWSARLRRLRRARHGAGREARRRSFWLPSALMMVIGTVLGIVVPILDNGYELSPTLFAFNDLGSARTVLTTIAGAAVSVVSLAFSITMVAVQLAAGQLGPRAVTTFREDWLGQWAMAQFVGLFAYCLMLMTQLTAQSTAVPETSTAFAVLWGLVALMLFVIFMGSVVSRLQAARVIECVALDSRRAVRSCHPQTIGRPAPDEQAAEERVARARREGVTKVLRAREGGYLLQLDEDQLMYAADLRPGVVVQVGRIGEYVLEGQPIAELHLQDDPGDELEAILDVYSEVFRFGGERTLAGDVGLSIRSLADVALRGLSPSLNDPATAETALGALVNVLMDFVRHCRGGEQIRVIEDDRPVLVAAVPDLDDLVAMGFEQVTIMVAGEQPQLARQVITWMRELERAAESAGEPTGEVVHQIELLGQTGHQDAGDVADESDGGSSGGLAPSQLRHLE